MLGALGVSLSAGGDVNWSSLEAAGLAVLMAT